MFEFPADHSAIAELFGTIQPNSPALWAVLEGRHEGLALVDDIINPAQCVVRTDATLTYCGDQTGQMFLENAIDYFRHVAPVWLVWPPGTSHQIPFPESGRIVRRVEFYDVPQSTAIVEWRRRLPQGFSIHRIDDKLLARCEWRHEMAFYCGSLENFLTNGLGFCLMRGNEIIVEAYASAFGGKRAEIGAITREKHRGRGYAPVVCAYLIEGCAQRGSQAYWSCDADNLASIRVARKLGFQQERAYQIVEYDSLRSSPSGASSQNFKV